MFLIVYDQVIYCCFLACILLTCLLICLNIYLLLLFLVRLFVCYLLTCLFICLFTCLFVCLLALLSAPADYIAITDGIITFSPNNIINHMLCGDVPIIMDDVVEDTETFFTILTSSDPAVNITQDNGTINILDNTSKHIATTTNLFP